MRAFIGIFVFLALSLISTAVVFLITSAVRFVLKRLLTSLSIHIPQVVRPLFDPSANDFDVPPELTMWQVASWSVVGILIVILTVYLVEIAGEFWYLISAR